MQSNQQSTTSLSSSSSSSSSSSPISAIKLSPPRKMTAAMRVARDRASSAADADDSLPLSLWLWGSSSSSSSSAHRPLMPRLALSDVTNIVNLKASNRTFSTSLARSHYKRRVFQHTVRSCFADENDSSMCGRCGIRVHTALHHESDFSRTGTGIRAPNRMSPTALLAEVKRCTRVDGSIGLVSLCGPCHRQAHRDAQTVFRPDRHSHSKRGRWRRAANDAAKLARGRCECDDKCNRPVTVSELGMFEWDHLVQSFDDPTYRSVGSLVHSASVERTDRERAKCRLLYVVCHRLHTGRQQQHRSSRAACFARTHVTHALKEDRFTTASRPSRCRRVRRGSCNQTMWECMVQ